MTTIRDYNYLVLTAFWENLEDIVSGVRAGLDCWLRSDRFRALTKSLSVTGIYECTPTPGGAHPIKAVVYKPNLFKQGCVMIADLEDGWNSMVISIMRSLKCRCVKVGSTQEGSTFPYNSIHIWDRGEDVRIIRAMLDGDRWEFFQRGEVQDFETPEYYKRRTIATRLNRQIVIEYMKRLGIDLENPSFFKSDMKATYFLEKRK